jgi:hypothetical protein
MTTPSGIFVKAARRKNEDYLPKIVANLSCSAGRTHFARTKIIFPIAVYCPFPGFIDRGKILLVGNMGLYEYRPYVR